MNVTISIADFIRDEPLPGQAAGLPFEADEGLIHGVTLQSLSGGTDGRGSLLELLTARKSEEAPIVHVYQVLAEPKSIRAWIIHHSQCDRLAFTNGSFRIVLYDIRPGSPTYGHLNRLNLGAARKALLKIPEFVVHGVQNLGNEVSSFVNMPTAVYDPGNPDKFRLPADHPGVPYDFSSLVD